MIEKDINQVDAERLLKQKENLDYIKNGADYMADLDSQLKNALESIRAGNGGYGEAAGALAGQAGMNLIQGSDAGAFVEGAQMGGPMMGIINTLVNAFANVIGGMEGLDKVLSPITDILTELGPTIKLVIDLLIKFIDNIAVALEPLFSFINQITTALMPIIEAVLAPLAYALNELMTALQPIFNFITQIISAVMPLVRIALDLLVALNPLLLIIKVIGGVLEIIEPLLLLISVGLQLFMNALTWVIKIITFGFIDLGNSMTTLNEVTRETNEERSKELEQLKKLNEQYAELRESIREQEEYYLQRRRKLNAEWAIETMTSVNDMILTPHGNFSTNPNDYIIATKNPHSLGSAGTVVNVVVHNEAGDVASASAQQSTNSDGMTEIAVMVRKIVANDIAAGKLDDAFRAKKSRDAGRRVVS
jgi:hypothetical protein